MIWCLYADDFTSLLKVNILFQPYYSAVSTASGPELNLS